MKFSQRTRQLDEWLLEDGLEKTWERMLKTHIQGYSKEHEVEDFSDHSDFVDCDIYNLDILEDLSLVDISLLFEYSLAKTDKNLRKQTGSYYTPEDVATFMAEQADTFKKGIWLDPASGVGNLSYALAERQEDPEDFILNHLILQDINPLALRVARTLFSLRFQNKVEGLYSKLEPNYRVKNFLDRDTTGYDYLILNPPYAVVKKNPDFLTKDCRNSYAYFLEEALTSSKGFISITPHSFLHSDRFKSLREVFLKESGEASFLNFDNMPDTIFKGYKYGSDNTNRANSVRATITVEKDTLGDYKTTPMLRWRSSEREEAIKSSPSELTVFTPSEEVFPKVSKGSAAFYDEIIEYRTLDTLISKTPTNYALNIPSTPRYYISTVKRDLSRSSMHTIFFKQEDDRDYAYLLLNSPYFFWWWRVVEGGLGITKKTVSSLPLLDFEVDETLVKKLEKEEEENLVTAVNAGVVSENIKFSETLVKELGSYLLADTQLVVELLSFTKNSFLKPDN